MASTVTAISTNGLFNYAAGPASQAPPQQHQQPASSQAASGEGIGEERMNGGVGGGAGGNRTGGGGGGSVRVPTLMERENNRLRERRRRAIAAKIFTGLRTNGNYQLPKHCDNNEVLRSLCNEAGWTVEPDGTTYRKGCKPTAAGDHTGIFQSATASPCPSYPLSPRASYNPSPASSSSRITFGGGSSSNNFFFAGGGVDGGNSFIPWLKTMSAARGPSYPSYGAASFSAPVTPPVSSPPLSPHLKMARWADNRAAARSSLPPWVTGAASSSRYGASQPHTTPPSPVDRRAPADLTTWLPEFQTSLTGGKSPVYSSSKLGTGGQNSCPRSPVVAYGGAVARGLGDAKTTEHGESECSLSLGGGHAMVSAWEGEVIKECAEEELELTLGNKRTRGDGA